MSIHYLKAYSAIINAVRNEFNTLGACFSRKEEDVLMVDELLDEYFDTPTIRSDSIHAFRQWVHDRADDDDENERY